MRGYSKRRGLKYKGNNMRYPKSGIAQRMLAVMNCIETKYKDKAVTTYTLDTTGPGVIGTRLFSPLADLAISTSEGTTPGSPHEVRVGNQIFLKSIQFRGKVYTTNPAAVVAVGNRAGFQARLIVAWDHQPNGAIPTTIANNLLVTETVDSFYALQTIGRYKVIYNKVYTLRPANFQLSPVLATNPDASNSNWVASAMINFYLPLKNKRITMNGVDGAISEFTNTNLLVFMLQEGADDLVNFELQYRLKFTD